MIVSKPNLENGPATLKNPDLSAEHWEMWKHFNNGQLSVNIAATVGTVVGRLCLRRIWQLAKLPGNLQNNVLPIVPKEDVREALQSLIGYYASRSSDLRTDWESILEDCRAWAVGALGLEQAPELSHAILAEAWHERFWWWKIVEWILVSNLIVDLDVEAILEDSAVDTVAGTGSSVGGTEIVGKEDTHRLDSVVEQGLGSRVDMGDERDMAVPVRVNKMGQM
ncbi:hypothetical protein BT69DRAFT_1389708 [Atractiella rhizophila]|nr:hypothetical protein BT69DRAFT_1389708 [Atractiella rhizophila]